MTSMSAEIEVDTDPATAFKVFTVTGVVPDGVDGTAQKRSRDFSVDGNTRNDLGRGQLRASLKCRYGPRPDAAVGPNLRPRRAT